MLTCSHIFSTPLFRQEKPPLSLAVFQDCRPTWHLGKATQMDKESQAGLSAEPQHCLLSQTRGFYLPRGQHQGKTPSRGREELLLKDHASKSTDGCSQHKETPLVSSAHRLNLQPTSWEPQRLMGLIVTVFPCMKLRTETCIFNNERTSRGRAEEVPGRQKGGS